MVDFKENLVKGWPVTVYFRTQEDAQKAAKVIGHFVGEEVQPKPLIDDPLLGKVIETFGKPSMALTVGLCERQIARTRKTPWDR